MNNSPSNAPTPSHNDRDPAEIRIAQAASVNPFDTLKQGPLAPLDLKNLHINQPQLNPDPYGLQRSMGNPFHSTTKPLPINPNAPAWGAA